MSETIVSRFCALAKRVNELSTQLNRAAVRGEGAVSEVA